MEEFLTKDIISSGKICSGCISCFRKFKWLWLIGNRTPCHPILWLTNWIPASRSSDFVYQWYDYRPNWTPFGPIVIINKYNFVSVEAGFEYVDLSMAVFVSVPLEAGLAIRLPTSQCNGTKPAELESFYGISGVNLGVSVGFLKKHLTLELPLGYRQSKRYW